MKYHIQKGDIITVLAPAGGIASGEGLVVGNIFGIAAYSAAVGDPLELVTTGVLSTSESHRRRADSRRTRGVGQHGQEHNVPGTGLFPVGIATEAVGAGSTSVAVRLDGIGTVAA